MISESAGRTPAPFEHSASAPRERRGARPGTSRERGLVMIWACAACVVVTGVVLSAAQRLRAVDEMASVEFSVDGQAREVAKAGLVDAYAWFRRQQVQPVTAFAPQRNLTATPPVNETDDAAVGLTRTFEISPGLWARYTVARGTPPESFRDANGDGCYDPGETFSDTDGDGAWSPGRGTRDLTAGRGLAGNGAVWRLHSRAQVFRRPRTDLPLGEGPNRRVAQGSLATEIGRLTVVPPAPAALCVSRAGGVSIGLRARVRSGGTCVAYGSSSGSPSLVGSELLGPLSTVLVPGWRDAVEDVFGVDLAVLKGMADLSTVDPTTVPSPLPDASLVVVTGNVTFDAARPLRGRAVVVVKGHVTIAAGSNSFFSGLLYVDGHLTVRAPALLRGVVVVRGNADLRGTGGDYVELEHDASVLANLLTLTGQYRFAKASYHPALLLADGRPDEAQGAPHRLRLDVSAP